MPHINLIDLIFAPLFYTSRTNSAASRRGCRDVLGGVFAGAENFP